MDLTKYPNVKRVMDETGATVEQIYKVLDEIIGEEYKENDSK